MAQPILITATLIVVLGIGLYLRLSSVNSALFFEDEYATAYQTLGIMETWKPTWPSGWVQWGEPVVLPYFMSFVWRVIGPDIMVGRLASVAVGMLSILMAYFLGRRLRGQVLGLVFAFLIATNLWSIASSTFFRSYALADLGFLCICYLSVVWLQGSRSLKSYLLVLVASGVITIIGHYMLLLLIPVVAMLPAVAKISDIIGERMRMSPLEQGQVKGAQFHIRLDTPMLVLLLSLMLVFILGTWLALQYGVLFAKAIGKVTGEFFEVIPEDARLTFKPFFVQSLQKFYSLRLLVLIIGGAFVMLVQVGRRGLALLLYFGFPFVVFSTLFASFTATDMFDRYMFPHNAVLLLLIAFLLVWVREYLAWGLAGVLPRVFREKALIMAGVVTFLLVLGLAIRSDAFLLRFDPTTTPASIEAWFRARNEPQTPSYHRVAMYIKENKAPNDVVLSTRGWEFPFELPDMEGYWVIDNPMEIGEGSIKTEDGFINRYTGHPAITNLGQFMDVIAEEKGVWLALPYFHNSPGCLTPGIWNFVHTHMRRISEASDNTIDVFRLEPGSFKVVPLVQVPEAYGNAWRVDELSDNSVRVWVNPGSVDWAGVQYSMPSLMDIRNIVFDLYIKLNEVEGEPQHINFILEEEDGDRWHTGHLTLQSGQEGQRFFVGFSNLSFWPLGLGTEQPDHVKWLKVEFITLEQPTFTAQVKVSLVMTKELEGLSP